MTQQQTDPARNPKGTPPQQPSLVGQQPGDPPRHRPTRKPFGAQEQKLAVPERAGYRRYWFNDIPGRLDRALQAGYTFVEDVDGKKKSQVVGTARGGGALTAYLMETPIDYFHEDMAAQQERVDQVDASIRRGEIAGKNLTNDDRDEHFYVGKQGIKVKDQTGPTIRRSG